MKNFGLFLLVLITLIGCNSTKLAPTKTENSTNSTKDTVRIANDSLAYEITIIEPGFNAWLQTRAKPRGYYSQNFLELRNRLLVAEWNRRVIDPNRYDPNLYTIPINYNSQIDYGYEVNYMLYYYFIYFQLNYKQQLTGFVPRL